MQSSESRFVQYNAVKCILVDYNSGQLSDSQFENWREICNQESGQLQYSTAPYSTVQYSTVQFSYQESGQLQYSTVQYHTVQYSTY